MNHTAAHLAELEWRDYSPDTIAQRRRALARLARVLPGPIIEATTDEIRTHLSRRQRDGRPLGPATKVAELAHLAAFYKWLVVEDHRVDDPTVKIVRPKLPRWIPHPIGEKELARAITQATERVRPWIMLAAYAGLRACEISPLRGEDVHLSASEPWLNVRRGKGGDARRVPVHPELAAEMRRHPSSGWVSPRRDLEPGPTPAHLVSQIANRHLHRLGIFETLHSCRHRFGTQVYRASGRDIRLTQELLGHRSVLSTQIYTKVEQGEAATVVAALPVP